MMNHFFLEWDLTFAFLATRKIIIYHSAINQPALENYYIPLDKIDCFVTNFKMIKAANGIGIKMLIMLLHIQCTWFHSVLKELVIRKIITKAEIIKISFNTISVVSEILKCDNHG